MKWDLSLAIDGVFDHRRMSVERIVREATSWGVIPESRAGTIVTETVAAIDGAIAAVTPVKDVSLGMVERLQWNVRRLTSGSEIGRPKR